MKGDSDHNFDHNSRLSPFVSICLNLKNSYISRYSRALKELKRAFTTNSSPVSRTMKASSSEEVFYIEKLVDHSFDPNFPKAIPNRAEDERTQQAKAICVLFFERRHGRKEDGFAAWRTNHPHDLRLQK